MDGKTEQITVDQMGEALTGLMQKGSRPRALPVFYSPKTSRKRLKSPDIIAPRGAFLTHRSFGKITKDDLLKR